MTALKSRYARKFTIDVFVRRSVNNFNTGIIIEKIASEYDQEIPQSHTADQPMAPQGNATEHLQ